MIELYEIFAGKVNYNTNYTLYCHCQLLSASYAASHRTRNSQNGVQTSEAGFASSADDPTDGTGDQTWQEKLLKALLCAISFPPANTDISISISQTHYCYQSSDCH